MGRLREKLDDDLTEPPAAEGMRPSYPCRPSGYRQGKILFSRHLYHRFQRFP